MGSTLLFYRYKLVGRGLDPISNYGSFFTDETTTADRNKAFLKEMMETLLEKHANLGYRFDCAEWDFVTSPPASWAQEQFLKSRKIIEEEKRRCFVLAGFCMMCTCGHSRTIHDDDHECAHMAEWTGHHPCSCEEFVDVHWGEENG